MSPAASLNIIDGTLILAKKTTNFNTTDDVVVACTGMQKYILLYIYTYYNATNKQLSYTSYIYNIYTYIRIL